MNDARVLVTGVGAISPLAVDTETHFARVLRGESAVRLSDRSEYSNFPARLQARVAEFGSRSRLSNRMLRKLLSLPATWAVLAARQAIDDAGLSASEEILQRSGIYVGSISVDINPEIFIPALKVSLNEHGDFEMARFAMRGMKLLDPLFLLKSLPNAGLCGISIEYQLRGPNLNITNGAVSGLQAVAAAAAAVARGVVDVCVAGGYDSMLGLDSVVEQMIAGRLSTRQADPERACRPFDRERDGYAVGEGAAFLVLERAEHALARSASVYGEILATSQTTIAGERQTAMPAGLEYAAHSVLSRAGCGPADLGVIFGDGLAVAEDDVREGNALRAVLGGRRVAFHGSTASIGFTGAASGAFSVVHAAMALHAQVIPPLLNCFQPDPRCAVHFVTHPESQAYDHALVWNSDRGAKNSALLLGRYG